MAIKVKVFKTEPVDKDEQTLTICIPLDAETAAGLNIGDMVSAEVKGKVVSVNISKGEYSYGAPGDVRLEIESIKVEGKNVFEDLIDD